MIKESVLTLAGGLGLFFFGMHIMSDGMKKFSGERMKRFLHRATKLPVMGVSVGALITMLFQSSSATTVMVVGLVNAGLLTLAQSISVIMGANIGTTFTAWIISVMGAFDISIYALLSVGVGVFFFKTAKTRKTRFAGEVLLGFGLLFTGLSLMGEAVGPLRSSGLVRDIFVSFSRNPLLGVLAGLVFTVLLQSSSATMALVQLLAFSGVIPFESAIPIILGENIGTTLTAQVAALGSNLSARRAAMSHTLFNLIGVGYMLVFVRLGWFTRFVDFLLPGEVTQSSIMFYIAFSHTLFNVFNTAVFLPFIKSLERMSLWLVPKREDDIEKGTKYLDRHLLESPAVALDQVVNEMCYMLGLADKSVRTAFGGFEGEGYKKAKKVAGYEEAINGLQSDITQFIVELSGRELADEEIAEIPVLIHGINDIERIGDHAENIIDLAERIEGRRQEFSEQAGEELNEIWEKILCMLDTTISALSDGSSGKAARVLEMEEEVNRLQKEIKENHIKRLNSGVCDTDTGIVFVSLIDNLEKIGDHLANIAEGIENRMRWRFEKNRR